MITMKKKTLIKSLILCLILAYCFYENIVGNMLFGLFTIILISSISVYIHELGHYIAAKILGNSPLYFIIGTTEIGLKNFNGLFKFKLFGTNFILNPLGHSGSVEGFTYMNKESRLKMSIICFSGPFANLLFGLLVLLFNLDFIVMHYHNGIDGFFTTFNKVDYEAHLLFIFLTVFFVNGINFLLNLMPFIKGLDGWFIRQLYKKEKNSDFYNLNIHKEMEKGLVNNKSFYEIIEPIYINNKY
jgi:hypothetical protein